MTFHHARDAASASLTCVECKAVWIDASERWRIYVTDDDPREAVVYCQWCALREFGPFHRRSLPIGEETI